MVAQLAALSEQRSEPAQKLIAAQESRESQNHNPAYS